MNQVISSPILSLIIPLFNEQGNIAPLVRQLDISIKKLDVSAEIIFIDDGSTDSTWDHIQSICNNHKNIRGIRLSRNFGHQYAMFAGLKTAKGQAIVTMDGDLQHPPHVIEEMFACWQNGAKIVNTIRDDAHVTGPIKRYFSKLFYMVFSHLSDLSIAEGSSDFRLIDRQVLCEIMSFGDVDIFLRGAIQWVGFQVETIKFKPEPRYLGKTKFTPARMIKLAGGAIVSYSTVPLKIGVWIGLFTALLSFMELGYIFYTYFKGGTVPGWASTIGITTLLFGILFLNIGVIGIYIARIHQSLQRRPPFIIREKYPFDPNE
ncbi:MAG: glycosyltransferase family 2 protein [Emcibacter sp.]|nr:glycosyltransferase family 2 protein [Emcibacter sp.]